ncbi:hypothetical protein [Reichenbachiella ulvae]|uniref:Uncharacterized protein n=1 Tax=Reichenbachiella ulvae TaxID=2980104 RepID=A0ABT3D0J6_9BACT|nr:hypothetical protein [Reichenbachiella ulvae]MCV9389341.1 hypothetical protein [Reichenbachiella ulvae]
MEKSIESIWKEGFLRDEALVAPKINNLYSQKSQQIIEKLGRMYKINLWSIAIFAGLYLIFSIWAQIVWSGIGVAGLLYWLVYISMKMSTELENLDQSQDSYHYLKAYDDWIQLCFERYIKIYRFLYPLLIGIGLSGMLFMQPRPFYEQPWVYSINGGYEPYLFMGLPVIWLGAIWGYALIFGIFARPIYKLDVKLIYGRTFDKLKGIIADMEKLRK